MMTDSVGRSLVGAATVAVFAATIGIIHAQDAPQVQQDARGVAEAVVQPAQGRGRGRAPAATTPAPRLPDGTVNLGRVPGEKGAWDVPYVTNMAMRVVGPDGRPLPEIATAQRAGRAGTGGREDSRAGGRGGSKSEPWMPWMPWSAALYDYNSANESKYDPEGYCLPPGGPRMMATPYRMDIVQLPQQKRILMFFEGATHIWREIYMDGRSFPEGDALNPTYLGYSIGHWENPDTLVVEVRGFNENSWLDYFGHPHTDMMRVTERWTRPSKERLHYEATVNDPGAYTKPFTLAWDIPFLADFEIPEYICQENNQYLIRLEDDFGQPIFGPRPQPGQRPTGGR